MSKRWMLDMTAEPVIPTWTVSHDIQTNGAELQRAILIGFAEKNDPIRSRDGGDAKFEKVLTFKEHGEFIRGALTMAGLRYTGDFYELLQRYQTIKVTLTKQEREDK